MIRSLFLVFSLLCLTAMPVLAGEKEEKKMDPKVTEEIRGTLKKHDEAMNNHDLKAVLEIYANSPDIIVMGTGPGEIWKGKAEIEDLYKHFFEDFEKGSLSHKCPFTFVEQKEHVAWLMASCQMKDKTKQGLREYVLNVSIVLGKQGESWKFHTMHFSNLTGGGQEGGK